MPAHQLRYAYLASKDRPGCHAGIHRPHPDRREHTAMVASLARRSPVRGRRRVGRGADPMRDERPVAGRTSDGPPPRRRLPKGGGDGRSRRPGPPIAAAGDDTLLDLEQRRHSLHRTGAPSLAAMRASNTRILPGRGAPIASFRCAFLCFVAISGSEQVIVRGCERHAGCRRAAGAACRAGSRRDGSRWPRQACRRAPPHRRPSLRHRRAPWRGRCPR